MVIRQLREFLRSAPFEPFELKLADGSVFKIRHPDYVSVSPRGRVIMWDKEDNAHHINPLLILSLAETSPKKRS